MIVNLADTNDLLTFIARFDNRRFDDATVLAWHPVVADLTLADCQQAVAQHFGTSDAYLMPVHIRRLVDGIKRDRVRALRAAEQRQAIEAHESVPRGTLRDRTAEIREFVASVRSVLPDGDEEALRPRAKHWEREHRAHQRQQSAVPNPDYDPSMQPIPEWSADRAKPAGCWWEDEQARERHSKVLLAEAGRLNGRPT